MKTLIVILVSIVGTVVVLGGGAFLVTKVGVGRPPPTVTVRVEPATSGPLVEVVSVPGEIEPRTKVEIRPRVSARIAELPHREEAVVEAAPVGTTNPSPKQLLVRLDDKDLRAARDGAKARADAQQAQIAVSKSRIAAQEATIRATEATLADAKRDRDRKEGLVKTFDISQSEVDTAQTRVAELTAQIESSKSTLLSETQGLEVLGYQLLASAAEVARAEEELSYTTITSPINGTIIRLNAEVGEQVIPGIQGSQGSVILEVADLSQMLMVARVDEANVAAVAKGQRATVRIQAFRDEVFDGEVESVSLAKPAAGSSASMSGRSSEGSNYYEAKIRLLDTKGRRIPTGLNADADIETKRHAGVRVPSQAVLGRGAETLPADLRKGTDNDKAFVSVVFRYVNGKAVATPVKVGPSDETHTLILEGLKEGDLIVSGPFKALDTLAHDQAVTKEDVPARAPVSRPSSTRPTTGPATTQASS